LKYKKQKINIEPIAININKNVNVLSKNLKINLEISVISLFIQKSSPVLSMPFSHPALCYVSFVRGGTTITLWALI
jgi:hypothetical protein